MSQPAIDTIVRAQKTLMDQHDVTSETALGLLVWAATDRGATVLDVAQSILARPHASFGFDSTLHATA
ncbi:ANTAR domain-containing protein [Aeromicrobium fastidiosum]|uniref:ANTAR domain-containing protein n=1 Tax=Aeromicrobium fastidiosum TaxID=52699 RepID=A0A641ARQ9_9ACTN|nr:ANTAR domain-containing protein [Aeromicrobium fastidiosum]KAA1380794.1 ANTAR domain-containing protein [Aeromicrobium fastidiosum]MBP2390417.1 AmiR/NasT family two-component response regulator [Aeromicrobium fastidiosum]